MSDRRIRLRAAEDEKSKNSGDEIRQLRETEKKTGTGRRKMPLTGILAVTVVVLFFLSLLFVVPWKQFNFTPAWIVSTVRQRFEMFCQFLFGGEQAFGITVYQYIAVIFTGAALASCGAVFQGGFRNVLAGPSTMGVMSGGSLGCLIYLLFFTEVSYESVETTADMEAYYNRTFFDIYGQQLFTLAGCFAGVALVLAVSFAAGRGSVSSSALILSGTVFSTLTQQISAVIRYYMIMSDPSDPRIDSLRDLMMGTFDRVTTAQTVLMMIVPIGICLIGAMIMRGHINLMSIDDDEARTMGLDLRRQRFIIVALGTVMTAVVVSFCGHIGFLGFMVPLVGRRLAGSDMKKLLPVSMLLGAIMLMIIYDAAYIAGLQSYLNMFTSSLGSILMIFTLLQKKGGGVMKRAAF